jgi:hypothetical protein
MPLANSDMPPDKLVHGSIQRGEGACLCRQVEIDALRTEPTPFPKNDDAQASHVATLDGMAAEGQTCAAETYPAGLLTVGRPRPSVPLTARAPWPDRREES